MDIVPTTLDPEQLQQVQGTAILHVRRPGAQTSDC
jgi:hypothetical protein